MSKSKNKNFLSEIESSFQKKSNSAIQAITRAIKAMKFTGRIPTLKTKRCHYIVVDTDMGGIPIRLFLCRRANTDGWKALLTTNTTLSFTKAYEIYAMRWSIEICFKECKQYLNLEGCQTQYFNSSVCSRPKCIEDKPS